MGGGGLTPKTRLPLIGQRGSGKKADQGGGSRLDRKNRFRDGKPAKQDRRGCWVLSLGPAPRNLWQYGGRGPPKEKTFILTLGRGPDSIRGGDCWSEIQMAWVLSATPCWSHFPSSGQWAQYNPHHARGFYEDKMHQTWHLQSTQSTLMAIRETLLPGFTFLYLQQEKKLAQEITSPKPFAATA